MTEEIVIRYNHQSWEQNRMINIDEYGVDLGTFEEQEPAPPKGWKPFCHMVKWETGMNKCVNPEVDMTLEPCLSCPFRE